MSLSPGLSVLAFNILRWRAQILPNFCVPAKCATVDYNCMLFQWGKSHAKLIIHCVIKQGKLPPNFTLLSWNIKKLHL